MFQKLIRFKNSAIQKSVIPGSPFLSSRRLFSFISYKIKRRLGLDYSFNPPGRSDIEIDVFIPAIEKDSEALAYCLESLQTMLLHPIGTIYVVAPPGSSKIMKVVEEHKCSFVEETSVVPVDKNSIDYVVNGETRNGWIYQMLLNLSSDKLCSNRFILILNADTIFIRPQLFIYKNKVLLNQSDEYHRPYFDANKRLLALNHRTSRSFITHYMLFDGNALASARDEIEAKWQVPWHQAIINNLDRSEPSSFADFEFYGDYYLSRNKKRYILNYWNNISVEINDKEEILKRVDELKTSYGSISLHNYFERDQ